MLALLCCWVATEFSVNKDLYNNPNSTNPSFKALYAKRPPYPNNSNANPQPAMYPRPKSYL